jgi:hypothetical protein
MARRCVRQVLPPKLTFLVYPNQSYDDNPRVGDEVTFPEDSLPDGIYDGPWSARQVVAFSWRNGRVPEWIDIGVEAADAEQTMLRLHCCGRFTAREELLYHRYRDGVPPFSIKSPWLPPGWENAETHGKFDLNWRAQTLTDRHRGCLGGACFPLRLLVYPGMRDRPRTQMAGLSDSAIFHRWMDLFWTLREPEAVALLTAHERGYLRDFNAAFASLPWRAIGGHPHISEVPDDDLSALLPAAVPLLHSLEARMRRPPAQRWWQRAIAFMRRRHE